MTPLNQTAVFLPSLCVRVPPQNCVSGSLKLGQDKLIDKTENGGKEKDKKRI